VEGGSLLGTSLALAGAELVIVVALAAFFTRTPQQLRGGMPFVWVVGMVVAMGASFALLPLWAAASAWLVIMAVVAFRTFRAS